MSSRLRVDEGAPELLLSPHWDDAVLSCWSLLSSGRELNVVNVFAGVPAAGRSGLWERVAGVADSAERARVRMREDALALSGAGRTAVNLALLDAQYRASTAALDDLDGALGAEIAGASRVYVPAAIGGHRDHLLVRSYGLMLLRLGMPVTLYAEHAVLHLPRLAVVGRRQRAGRQPRCRRLLGLVPARSARASGPAERPSRPPGRADRPGQARGDALL